MGVTSMEKGVVVSKTVLKRTVSAHICVHARLSCFFLLFAVLVLLFVIVGLISIGRLYPGVDSPHSGEPPVLPHVDFQVARARDLDVDALGDERVALARGAVCAGAARGDGARGGDDAVPWDGRCHVRG